MSLFSKPDAKSQSKTKALLGGTASRRPLGLMALEPRVLLDAAGFVTAADGLADAGADMAAQSAANAAQALFAAPMQHDLAQPLDRSAQAEDGTYSLIQSLTDADQNAEADMVNADGDKLVVYEPAEDIAALSPPAQINDIPDKPVIYEPAPIEDAPDLPPAQPFDRSALSPRFDFADSPNAALITSRYAAEHVDTLTEFDASFDTGEEIDGPAYASSTGIVFVDTAVADYQSIIDGLDPGLEVVLIERGQDGVMLMAETLAGRENVQSVHIISHSRSGNLTLGTATLNAQSISETYGNALSDIGAALTRSGDILIYGCDFGGDIEAVQALALATGADIAASNDDTGAAALGGDWDLETRSGEVETEALSADSFEGLLAPLTISLTTPGPTLLDGTPFNILTSFSAGDQVMWANAGNVGGTSVDLIATVVSVDPGVHLSFNNNGDDPGVVMLTGVDLGTGPLGSAAGSATVEWSIVIAGTTTPLSGTPVFTVSDIDGSGVPFTIETIAPNMENLQTAELAPGSAIDLSTSAGQLFASGTDDDGAGAPGGNLRTSAAVRFTWAETDSWQISYTAERDNDGRLFAHDGDGDFNLGASPTAFVIPQIDLDGDNSSGASNADYQAGYLLGSAGIAIGDALGGDIDITIGSGVSVTGAVITLTNPQAGDTLSVSGLPAGITLDPASTASQIILTGNGSAADYEAAIAAILFANPVEGGNTDDRVITVEFSETQSFSSNIATATLSVTQPPNDAPDAISDTMTTDEETAISGSVFVANGAGPDNDPNGDSFVVSEVNGAPGNVGTAIAGSFGGSFIINPDGSYNFDPGNDFQDLAAGEVRHTTVTYQIDDGRGGLDTATVTVSVNGLNDAPVPLDPANPGLPPADPANYIPAQSGIDGSAITAIDLTPYYMEADTNDSVSITLDPADLPPGLIFDGMSVIGTPDANASQGGAGGVYVIPVTYDDGNGGSFTTNLTITITNTVPDAQNDGFAADQNTPVTGSVFADNGNGADTDADMDSFTVSAVNGAGANVGAATDGDNGGSFVIDANGMLSFDPDGDFTDLAAGEFRTTTISYTIDDGEGGTDTAIVSVTVEGVNDAPVPVDPLNPAAPPTDPANYIPAQSGQDSSAITPLDLTPYFGDADSSDTVTISLDPADLPPGLSFDGSAISGTPDASASQGGTGGVYTVPVTYDDGNGGSFTTNVTFTITNPAPAAQDDALGTDEDTPISGSVFANNGSGIDADPDGDSISVSAVNGDPAGVGASVSGDMGGQFVINPDGIYSFDPSGAFEDLAAGETRTTSLTYTLDDGEGGTDTATVSVTVTGVNDAPVPVNPADPGTPPADPSAYIPAQPASDSEPVSPLNLAQYFDDPDGSDSVTLTINPADLPPGLSFDGTSISGAPDADASQGGTGGVYTIAVTASDGNGGSFTTNVTYTVTNPAPVVDTPIGPQAAFDNEIISIPAAFSDPDGDTLSYSASGLPAGLSIDPVTGEISGTVDNSASQGGPLGDGVYSVTVTADDGEGGAVDDTFTLTITNPAPVVDTPIGPQTALDNEIISIPAAFSDPDGDTLSYSVSGLPAGLTFDPATGKISGTVDHSASQGGPLADGVYTVTVTADDGEGGAVDDTFTLTITNPAPTAQNDTLATDQNTPAAGNVLTGLGSGPDTDPDGDDLSVAGVNGDPALVGAPVPGDMGGSFTLSANGDLAFNPGSDFDDLATGEFRTTTLSYTITDGEGGTDTASVTVTVEGVNDAPVPADPANPGTPPADPANFIPAQSGTDSSAVTPLDLTPYFADADTSDSVTISLDPADLPPGLTFDGTAITGMPDANASQGGAGGVYVIPVTYDDGNGGSFTTNVTYTIINPAPVAENDSLAAGEDAPISGSVFANNGNGPDTDPDGDMIVVSSVAGDAANVGTAQPGDAGGVFTINEDGTFSFDPAGGFEDLGDGETRLTTITYEISDGEGGTDTAIASVLVSGANDAPVTAAIIANAAITDGETALSIDAASAFGDVDDAGLTYSLDPSAPAWLSIDALSGEISINGAVPANASQNTNAASPGTYSVTVIAADPDGEQAQADFVITVSNIAPIAVDDSSSGDENMVQSGNVLTDALSGDSDTAPDGDDLAVSAISGGAVGAPIALTYGELLMDSSGGWVFTPNTLANALAAGESATEQVIYTIDDGNGGSDSAVLTINISGSNDAPVPFDPASPGMAPADPAAYLPAMDGVDNTPITPIDLSAYVSDSDSSDDITISLDPADLPAGLSFDGTSISGTFDPGASTGGTGGVYTVPITYDDGNGGSFTTNLTITVTNTIPDAVDDGLSTDEDTPISGSVFTDNGSGPDTDADGDVFIVAAVNGDPADVGAAISGDMGGQFIINDNGSYSFDPGDDFQDLAIGETRTTSLTYTIDDGEGGTDTATISVNVTGVNDAPVPIDPASPGLPTADPADYIPVQTGEDDGPVTPLDLTAYIGDPDASDNVTISLDPADLPPGLTFDGSTVSGTLAPDASQGGNGGSYIIPVTYDDGHGGTLVTNITYSVGNPAPVVDTPIGPQAALDNAAVSIPAVISDPDGDTLSYSASGLPAGLSIDPLTGEISGTVDNSASLGGPLGDGVYSVTVTADDGEGGTVDDIFTLTITNPAPVVDTPIGPQAALDNAAVSIPAVISDPDGDTLSYSASGLPAGLSIDPLTGEISGTVDNSASLGGPLGDGVYSVTVTADDGEGGTVDDTFTLTITNPAPDAADDAMTTDENTPVSGSVFANNGSGADFDPDGDVINVAAVNGDPAQVNASVLGDQGGQFIINADGSYSFDPGDDFQDLAIGESRTTSINYTIDDGEGGTDTAAVTVTVTGVNDPAQPFNPANPGTLPADPSNYIPVQTGTDSGPFTPLDLSIYIQDTDGSDGVIITLDPADLPPGLIFDGSTISGTPESGASTGGDGGHYVIPVTFDDGNGGSFTTNVTIVIENTPPQAASDTALTDEDTPVSGNVFADNGQGPDIDPDGDSFAVSAVGNDPALTGQPASGSGGGTFTVHPDGSYSFDPGDDFQDLAAGESRTTTISYTIDDGEGGADTAEISVTVTGNNDAPALLAALPDRSSFDGQTIAPINILPAFGDAESETLSFTASGLPEGLSLDPQTGEITGTLPSGASADGPYMVSITAADPHGAEISASFVWTVDNIAPVVMSPFAPASGTDGAPISMATADHFADSDGDKLIYSAQGLPDGLSIDPDTGIISGQLSGAASMSGPMAIIVTATDADGASISETLMLTAQNPAPELCALDPVSVIAGEAVLLDISALAADIDGDTLSYSAADLPDGLSLDPVTGILSGAPIVPSPEPYQIEITVSDGQGGAAVQTLSLTVNEDAFVAMPMDRELLPLGADGLGETSPSESSGLDGGLGDGRMDADTLTLRKIFDERERGQSLQDVLALYDYDLRGGMAVAADIAGLENGAQVSVEGVAGETAIFVQLSETISSLTGNMVERWSVSHDGAGLPAWIDYPSGGDFLILNRTISDEQVLLRITAHFENGRTVTGRFQIDMRTGEVELIGNMSAQSPTLSQQFADITAREARQNAELITALTA